MSDLPKAGVQLVAEGSDTFFGQLGQGENAMAQFGRAATTTAGSITGLGSAQDNAAQKIANLSQKIDLQQRQLDILQQELATTAAKYGEGSLQAQKKQLAVDKLTASIGQNERQLQEEITALTTEAQAAEAAGQKTSWFGEIMTGAMRAVGQFAVQALMRGVQALKDFATGSIEAATAYQRTMSDIVGLTGTSAESVGTLSTAVLSLAGDVAQAPQDLAKGLYFIASSGFQGADALTVLEASAKAAAAGLGDTKTIADLTTSTLNAYQMGANQAAHVTDILTQAVKDGKAEPDQLAGALGRVLPVAAAAGINLEEVAASVASMTRVGLDANESVTALRGVIGALEKPSKQAGDALKAMGLSADDVRQSIRDKGLLATLQDLYGRTNGNLDVLGKLIPNVRALTGVLATTASQGEAYAQTLQHMYSASGATEAAFKQATQTLDFQQRALTSTISALQIELGQALIPALTAGVHGALEFAQSLQGKVGPAVTEIIDVVSTVARTVSDLALPAVTGLTTALIAYALIQSGQALPAILEMIPALIEQTAAMAANALAVATAVAPYVLIAAAIGGVVYAYQSYTQKVQDATEQLLESRQWWQDSTAAIDDYSHAVGTARETLTPYITTIQALRGEIESEIEVLGKRMAAGNITQAQYDREIAKINDERQQLASMTQSYNDAEQALLRTAAASQTGTAQLQALQQGEQGVEDQTKLTEKELEQLEKQIQKTFDEGAKAVGAYVDTEVGFLNTLAEKHQAHEDKMLALTRERQAATTEAQRQEIDKRLDAEQKAYAQEEQNQALAYAKQQAAQRAHLGQMLEDYTLEQVKLGNITGETADKILAQIEQQFGQVQDVSGRTFLQMTSDIDAAGRQGGSALDSLGTHLGDTADKAVDLKMKADQLQKTWTMEVQEDFDAHRITVEQYLKKLREIPPRVNTEVHTTYTHSGTNDSGTSDTGSAYGGHAAGGSFGSDKPFWVGEQGPELIWPDFSGAVVPNDQLRGALASMGAMGSAAASGAAAMDAAQRLAQQIIVPAPLQAGQMMGGTTVNQSNTTNMSMPVYTTQSPAVLQQSYAVMQALYGRS